MAAGCPLLADVELLLTVDGIIVMVSTTLKTLNVLNWREEGAATPEGFPSVEELHVLFVCLQSSLLPEPRGVVYVTHGRLLLLVGVMIPGVEPRWTGTSVERSNKNKQTIKNK